MKGVMSVFDYQLFLSATYLISLQLIQPAADVWQRKCNPGLDQVFNQLFTNFETSPCSLLSFKSVKNGVETPACLYFYIRNHFIRVFFLVQLTQIKVILRQVRADNSKTRSKEKYHTSILWMQKSIQSPWKFMESYTSSKNKQIKSNFGPLYEYSLLNSLSKPKYHVLTCIFSPKKFQYFQL